MTDRNEERIIIQLYCILNGLKYLGTFEDDNELAFCKQALEAIPENILSVNYKTIVKNLSRNIDNVLAYCIVGQDETLDEINDTIEHILDTEYNINWNVDTQAYVQGK